MAAGRIVLSQYFPARDRSARLVSGALLYVYTNGTTTKASIYSDEALTTPLANPVAANSSGQFPAIWASDAAPYTLSITGPDGESIGNPSVFDDYSVSTDADTASVALAEAAAASAAADLADMLAVVATGDDAAAIAARAAKAANLSDLASVEVALRSLGTYATRALAVAASIPLVLTTITLRGYATAGDGGEALYSRAASEPAHPGKLQSADGAWWEMVAQQFALLEQFGAKGDAVIAADGYTPTSLGTNDQQAWDDCQDYLIAKGGGTIQLMAKCYRLNSGGNCWSHNSVIGSKGGSAILKPGTATQTITPAGVAVGGLSSQVYPDTSLPTAINAVMVLDGSGGRWVGRFENVTLIGSLSGTNFETDLQTEFGLVSTGSISDSVIAGVTVNVCKQAVLLPDIFTSTVSGNRANRCWRGFGLNKGTSLTYHGNYASSCRDYGHVIRDFLYGGASGNACDFLNDPALYATRTRIAYAYKLIGLDGFTFENNGQEETHGTNFYLDVLRDCRLAQNTVVGLGSDYVGTGDIAIWEMTGNEQRTIIENNPVVGYAAAGLIQGAANAAKHHNVLSNARTDQRLVTWRNNTVRETRNGALTSGYGNNANPPLERVRYDILYDGVNDAMIEGDGVTAAKGGTGVYTFTFDTAFVDVNFIVTTGLTRVVGATGGEAMGVEIGARTTTSVAVECEYYEGTNYDFERVCLMVAGFVDRMA